MENFSYPSSSSTETGDLMTEFNPLEMRVGFGKRFGAYLMDFLIVSIIGGLVTAFMSDTLLQFADASSLEQMSKLQESGAGGIASFSMFMMSFGVAATVLGFLYSFVEMLTGASPAKHILGITVANQDGKRGDLKLFATRWAIKSGAALFGIIAFVPALIFFKYVGMVWNVAIFLGCFVVLSEKKMALHDIIAKTAVFHKEDLQD